MDKDFTVSQRQHVRSVALLAERLAGALDSRKTT
jgi:hypothetical protein